MPSCATCIPWMRLQALKWVTLVASCLVMLSAGSMFTFSVFSNGLRKRFAYSSSDVNLISGFGNTALYLSFIFIGPMFDKLGARVTLSFGTLAYGAGYLMMWLAYERKLGMEVSPLMMSIFYFAAGCGSTSSYMATIGVNIINFKPKYTGLVTAILLLFYGISGSVYSQIYSAFYASVSNGEDNTGGYLLFLFITTTVINFVCIFLLFSIPYSKEKAILDSAERKALSRSTEHLRPVRSVEVQDENSNIPLNQLRPKDSENPGTPKESQVLIATTSSDPPDRSMTPGQILMSSIFWLFTLVYILQQGLTYITNVTAIVQAIEGPKAELEMVLKKGADHVTLIAAAQAVGRFVFALVSDIIGEKLGFDRSFLLVLSELILLLPMMTLAIGTDSIDVGINLLWMCSAFVGLGWGAAGALFPPLTKDFFGTKWYGTACGFVMSGVPIGIIFSNQIFGIFYDTQSEKGGPNRICYGKECFQSAFTVSAGIQAMAFIISIMLFRFRMMGS